MKNAWRSPRAGAALIILLTVLTYLPALRAGFVFDDYPLITDNRLVKANDGFRRFWLTTQAPDYYPLTWSLWWVEWRLWGPHPLGYHAVNVLLHAANAILIWTILRRLKIPGAWLAGLVFAVHPVNVATVAWISEQKNTLSLLFFLTALLWYLRFDEEARWPRPERGWRWYGLSLAAFLLALFSKTAVVMLPVVLLGHVWWRRSRLQRKDFLNTLPFFALSLIFGLVTIWFQHNYLLTGYKVSPLDFCQRLALAGAVPWFYLYKACLPINLTVVYPKWALAAPISCIPGIALLGCVAWFWWKRRTWGRPLLFGLGYFLVTLFPVLGFFDQGFYRFSWVADHWQYYSIIGVMALAVAGGVSISDRVGKQGRVWATVTAVLVLSILAAGSWARSCLFANDETLWNDNVAKNPNAWLAQNNLGTAFGRAGRVNAAIAHLEQAIRIEPDYAPAYSNLGNVLLLAGRYEGAIAQYQQALRLDPNLPELHYNLGNALFQIGKLQEAIREYELSLQLQPNYAEAHNHLGKALARMGKMTEAIDHYEQAVRLRPGYAGAHFNLALALEREQRVPEAIEHYQQALQIKPDYAEARNKLARLQTVQ